MGYLTFYCWNVRNLYGSCSLGLCQIYDLHPSTQPSVSPSSLSIWTQGYLFYYLGYYCCLCFWSDFSSFEHWYLFFSFRLVSVSRKSCLPLFKHFFSFWHHKMLLAHLIFFLPQLCYQLPLQGALILFTEEWYLAIDIWIFGVLIATGCHCFIFHI